MALAAVASEAIAQTALEEIVVTAERRETVLQDTPLAISAFSREGMQLLQLTEPTDLMRLVPNFSINNNVGSGTAISYWLRGSGVGESIATFDPPVGTYIDEVFDPRINAAQLELLDLERVEVLRGPQGTLFGRNTTAGALSFISRKPQPVFEGQVDLSYGRFDSKTAKLILNQPFTEKIFGRVSAYYAESDGPMRSLTTGDRYNGKDTWGMRGAVRFLLSEDVDWNISATYTEASELGIGTALAVGKIPARDGVEQSVLSGDLFRNFVGLRPCSPSGDIYNAALAGCTFNDAERTLLISNLAWQLGNSTLALVTGYNNTQVRNSVDYLDNHPQQPLGPFVGPHYLIIADIDMESFSQEAKLSGELFKGRASYVAGLFYMREENRSLIGDLGGLDPIVFTRRDLRNDTTSSAAYAQVDFDLSERLSLTAGIRFTNEKKDIDVNYTNELAGVTFTNADLVAVGIPTHQTEDRWTPKIGLQYQITDGVMTYISATNGFKSGGWNARVDQAVNLVAFGPEKVWSYEAGLKADWLNSRMRTNVTAFYANYEDRQIATSYPGTTTFVTTNAGDTPIKGLEVEVSTMPIAGLNIYVTAGLMDGKLSNLTQSAIDSGLTSDTVPLQTPDWTLLAGFSYDFEVAALGGRMTIAADVSDKDLYYMDWQNLPDQEIDEPKLVNASVAYRPKSERWRLALECKNCTDQDWTRLNLLQVAYPGKPMEANLSFTAWFN